MIKILAFGDSLTEGYGLTREDSFASQLESRLIHMGYDVKVINAGLSGDTTFGGLRRLGFYLKEMPDLVILELGINDGFLEYPIEDIKNNLEKMIVDIQKIGAEILLIGTKIPMIFDEIDENYSREFENMFYNLAEKYNIELTHDFLGGIVENKRLTLPDGVHPNKEGVSLMVEKVINNVVKILNKIGVGEKK